MADSIPKEVIDTLIAEAYAQGPEGMRRVAETIINRAAIRGLSLEQVVTQPYQYTGYSRSGPEAAKAQGNPQARAAAEAALREALKPGDPTNGADHYYAPGSVAQPSWARSMDPRGDYGGHRFYASTPIPPASIPNVVASYTDTQRPVTPVMPTPLPPMLAAQRNLQPTTRDAAALYAGIFPTQPAPRPAASTPSRSSAPMVSGSGIADSFGSAAAATDPALAAALARRVAGPPPVAQMTRAEQRADNGQNRPRTPVPVPPPVRNYPPAMTTAQMRMDNGQTRPQSPPVRLPPIPPSNSVNQRHFDVTAQREAEAQRPELAAALNARPVTPEQIAAIPYARGTPVATIPTRPPVAPMTTAQIRADNGQVRPPIAPRIPAPTIPGPPSVAKIEDRLTPGEWGVPRISSPMPTVAAPPINIVPRPVPVTGYPTPSTMRPGFGAPVPGFPTPYSARPAAPIPLPYSSRPVTAFPTPVAQRPAQRSLLSVIMPTPVSQRPMQATAGTPARPVSTAGGYVVGGMGGGGGPISTGPRVEHNGVEVFATPSKRYNTDTNQFENVTVYKPR